MQSTNVHQGSSSNDFRWHLLGEYSLSGLLPHPEKDPQRMIELPSTMVQEMDIRLERVESIEMALRSFAAQALRQMQPDREMHPGKIRLFCQKKILDEGMKGAWGYFVIEKPRDASSQDDDEETREVMDLYIYEEGY